MDPNLKKSSDRSRALLFGLLVNCIFSGGTGDNCPLTELRRSLTIEEKYDYVMSLSKNEVTSILVQHEECFEQKLSNIERL